MIPVCHTGIERPVSFSPRRRRPIPCYICLGAVVGSRRGDGDREGGDDRPWLVGGRQ